MATPSCNLTPRLINTFFLLTLQEHFKQHAEFKWSPDDASTQIDITTGYSEDGRTQATVPALVVQNGSITISPAGIGNGYGTLAPQQVYVGNKLIKKEALLDTQLNMTVQGYTQILILGFSQDAVEELAFEVATLMNSIRYLSGTILGLQAMPSSIQISPVQQATQIGWSGKYQCGITIPYVFNVARTYVPVDDGILLRSIETCLKPVNQEIYDKTGDEVADGIDDNEITLRFKASLDNKIAN